MLEKRKISAYLITIIVLIASLSLFLFPIFTASRAMLANPRLGNAIQTFPTKGPGLNTTIYLNETTTFWISPDPAESPIPISWYNEDNWDVALIPSVLPTANCTLLNVKEIITGNNLGSVFGGGMDVNPLYPTAVGLVCNIPANIPPLLHNLAVSFKNPITTIKQLNQDINLIPNIGSWIGSKGSGNGDPFLLVEASCVSVPWYFDARSSENLTKTYNDMPLNPFTFLHVSDTHFEASKQDRILNNVKWMNDAQIISPDLVILSGDLIENDLNVPSDYAHAYTYLKDSCLPYIINAGNHDQYLLGPWRHFIGPLYSSNQYDDLKIVSFDTSLPFSSGVNNWIDSQVKTAKDTDPVILTGHYPIWGSYFTSGWMSISEIMIQNDVDAILTGHYHADIIGKWTPMYDILKANFSDFVGLKNSLAEFDQAKDYLKPITEPTAFVTRSAGKPSYDEEFNLGTPQFSGYRKFTITNNQLSNFTYDFANDGERDPQICTPSGRFTTELIYDPDIGVDVNANATMMINSSMNEEIRAARASILVPNAPIGKTWDISTLNKTAGAYIRASVSNSTHSWYDIRFNLPKNSVQWIKMVLI